MRKQRKPSARVGKRSEYFANHVKVRDARGPAWQHTCEHCGSPANHWATIHETTGESPEDYMALCWSCHAKYDDFAGRLPDNTGSKRSAESRELMSKVALERFKNPEAREKMRKAALLREARKRGEVV
jgi:hypothetical protein